jgi:hypothetical protein
MDIFEKIITQDRGKDIMKTIGLLFALGLSIAPSVALCKTEVANSMQAVQSIFEQSTGETLGLFDIDMVLIQTSVPAFQMANMKEHKAALKALLEPLSPLEKDMTLMLTLRQGHAILVEPQTPGILNNIRQHQNKLIAFTSTLTGQWGDINDGIAFRAKQLKSVDIDFSASFPLTKPLIFNQIKPYRNQHPEFKQGILAANGEQKGAALIAFLQKIDYKPNTIIFVDDREKNIQDVEKSLSQYNAKIKFIGIIYKGAERYPSERIDETSFKKAWVEKIQQAKETVELEDIEN